MKDKRNCGGIPPMMPGPMPMMGMPTPYGMGYNQGYSNNSINSNTLEQQLNSINQQINNLESRVTKLESMTGNTTYNDTNYYMV